MEWSEKDIQKAIAKSKTLKSLFVVLVEDDKTSEGEAWQSNQVKDIVNENKCVLVRLQADSTSASQFRQIYPVFAYPIVYFIGENGKVLGVTKGHVSVEELIKSFNKALELHGSAQSSSSSSQLPEMLPVSSPPPPAASKSSPSSKHTKPPLSTATAPALESVPNTRTEAQKEKIQQDLDEARKRKNIEYQAVRGQMKAKEESEKMEKEELMKEKRQEKMETSKKRVAMIQFKLPDGSTLVSSFAPEDKLIMAKQFVLENLEGRVKNIKLSQLLPWVLIEDYEKTFDEYKLLPSSVLVVLYEAESTPTTGAFSLMALWARFILVLQYLLSWIIPSSPSQAALSSPPHSSHSSAAPSSDSGARPKTNNQGLRQRREGNIHRLTADDEDDDAATWNGNSTQQM